METLLTKDISSLERFQMRATECTLNDYHSPYKNQTIQLDLLPLLFEYQLSDSQNPIKTPTLILASTILCQ